MTYHRRILDDLLDDLAPALPALAIEGPRGIGKTSTAEQRATTVWRLDDPTELEILRSDPSRLLQSVAPVLIDEWQVEPSVWDRVRRSVDDDPQPGRYLLTGSALPLHLPAHTGAGRIVAVRMRPLALCERWDAPDLTQPTVSLSGLLSGSGAQITGETTAGLERYIEEIMASGLPSIRGLPDRARDLALTSYVENALTADFAAVGYTTRVPAALRQWVAAYAASTSTTTSWAKINRAAQPGGDDVVSRQAATQFREALAAIRLLDEVPAWLPSLNLLNELAQAPKHHLADPALAVSLLNVSQDRLLAGGDAEPSIPRDGTFVGALFESLAALSLRVYAQAADAKVAHMRVRNGRHEIDFVIEGKDQSLVAIEIKLAATVKDRDARHLNWLDDHLREKEGHRGLTDKVIITTGTHAYRRPDGVAVVPLALLGP